VPSPSTQIEPPSRTSARGTRSADQLDEPPADRASLSNGWNFSPQALKPKCTPAAPVVDVVDEDRAAVAQPRVVDRLDARRPRRAAPRAASAARRSSAQTIVSGSNAATACAVAA
jgi:hypothetical protein